MRLLRIQATADGRADAAPDDMAAAEPGPPADTAAAHVAYRVDDDLDAQALPDFDLITAEPAEGAEGAEGAEPAA